MKTTTFAAIVAGAFLAAMPLAHAEGWGWGGHGHHGRGGHHGGPGFAMRMMERFDADKDGKITQAEIDAAQTERFAKANSDGQGGVTIQEFGPFFAEEHRERMVRAFQRLDSDGDGQISKEEFDARTAGMVQRMDRNGDGALTRDDRPRWGRDGGPRRHWMPGADDDGSEGEDDTPPAGGNQ